MIYFDLLLIDGWFPAGKSGDLLVGHATWQWDFLIEGQMCMQFPDEEIAITSGDSILTPPSLAHAFRWDVPSRQTSVRFDWSMPVVNDLIRPICIPSNHLSSELLARFFRYGRYSDTAHQTAAACCFHLLLYDYFQMMDKPDSTNKTLADRVLCELEGNLFHPISVVEMARRMHVSVNHFIRLLRTNEGQTPGRFMLQRRIERAASLLCQSDASITAVALSLGFPDLYTFSKAFKRIMKISPTKWIETHDSSPSES